MRDEPIDWEVLIPLLLHPIKVAIVEAMLWIDEPCSAIDINLMHAGVPGTSKVAYHLKKLAFGLPVLCLYDEESIRGTHRRLYFFRGRTPASKRRKRAA